MKYFLIIISLITAVLNAFGQPPIPERNLHELEKIFAESRRHLHLKKPGAAQDQFDVKRYQLNLDLYPAENILSGSVVIEGTSLTASLAALEIDLYQHMEVDSILDRGLAVWFDHSDDIIKIPLSKALSVNEEFSITIFYHGNPQESLYRSFGWSTHGNNVPIIWTLSEPYGSPAWWPCKDDPKDKADKVELNINVPDDLIVASNGILTAISNVNGRSTYHWETNYPISTYLVSLAVSDYEQFSDWHVSADSDSMEITFYVYPEHLSQAFEDLRVTADMMEFYSAILGEYPFIKEKYGMAVFPWGGGMEHQTITSYGAGLIQGNHRYDYINAHELAHQWFGDAITMRFWSHIWLNEGFASYAEALWFEHLYGKQYYHQYVNSFDRYPPLSGPLFIADSLNDNALFSRTVYDKGGFTLHMLRGVLGDSVFFQCLKEYAQKSRFVYGTATTEDFQSLCEKVCGFELSWFFEQWVYRGDRPVYEIIWSVTGTDPYTTTLNITQRNNQPFKMPVEIKLEFGLQDTTFTVWNEGSFQQYNFVTSEKPLDLVLDPDNWILKSSIASRVDEDLRNIPVTFEVGNNYPNPFNPGTLIPVSLPVDAAVTLEVYNVLGEKIYSESKNYSAGYHNIMWGGKSERGVDAPSGIYFYRISIPSASRTKRMILLR